MSLVRSKWFSVQLSCGLTWRQSLPGNSCVAALIVAGLAGGCSTDVSRFDMPLMGVTETASAPPLPPPRGRSGVGGPPETISSDNVVRPIPRDGAGSLVRGSAGGSAGNGVNVASLPDVTAAQPKIPVDVPPVKRAAARPAAPATVASVTPPTTAPAKGGQTIDVAQGDTLYRLAAQHRVSIADLMAANNMQSPVIKPGQKLIIPAVTSVPQNRVPTRVEAQQRATQQAVQTMRPATEAGAAPIAPAGPATTPVGTVAAAHVATPAAAPGGNYTVQPGESFYGIARKHKVKAEDLAQVNGVSDVTKIKQGQVLKIPGPGVVAAAPAAAAVPATAHAAPAHGATSAPVKQASAPSPKVGATGAKVAALGNTATNSAASDLVTATDQTGIADPKETAAAAKGKAEPARPASITKASAPATATGAGNFRWPVKGKVITGFGPRDDGSHNDGINIAVPAGTDVQAAESGTVAYAGNELKGYGNLILIRHDDSWVSAYAHNDQLLVKRGDKIQRGQVVAKAGKSGTVDQPQVHFELRQGSKPVDPMKHLAAN